MRGKPPRRTCKLCGLSAATSEAGQMVRVREAAPRTKSRLHAPGNQAFLYIDSKQCQQETQAAAPCR